MKSYIKNLVSKAPAPDEMDSEAIESDEPDEGADDAAQLSAMQDYIKAIKTGDAKAALEGFKELSSYCK